MSMTETLKRQIAELERRISENAQDVDTLKVMLHKLKMQEFEEDIRESDNRRLLNE